jgi:phosphoglycolate phosphatase-like HAD superfamily hydrolase
LTIVVDLDGTLIDTSQRHYACYSEVARACGIEPEPVATWWPSIREGTPTSATLQADEVTTARFRAGWLARIEAADLLALDTLVAGALETLTAWREAGHALVLCTLRQHPDGVLAQLATFGIDRRVDAVLVVEHPAGADDKAEAVAGHLGGGGAPLAWVGDTEVDIEAARSVGSPAWAVASGVRSRAFLQRLGPDRLADDITGLV